MEAPGNYKLLGPVVCIPAVLEIFQTMQFHQNVISAFITDCYNQTFRMSSEYILEELRECICTNRYRLPSSNTRHSQSVWWESLFTRHLLVKLNDIRGSSQQCSEELNLISEYGVRIKGFSALVQVSI